MAHRFCFPDWPEADGAAVTKWSPVNGVSGAWWPETGTVYKTLAATYASGGHTIWLPHGYRLVPPANGVWLNALNSIDATRGKLIIRAYDAGLGARDPVADAAARARIRRAAYFFDEAEFRAGAADCWSAMKWPVIDFGYYTTPGEWTYVGAGSGGHIWRAIFPWTMGAADAPGVLMMRVGARAPTNKTADMVLGTMSQQAYTQGDMSASPDYQASESVGIWHSYRSNSSGTLTSGGGYSTVLIVLPVPSVDPATYHNGVMLVGSNIPEAAILVRNGGSLDAEDLAIHNVRYGIRVGVYSNTTRNGPTTLTRVHQHTNCKRAFQVHSSTDTVADCGDVVMTDCSYDTGANADCTNDLDSADEPRSLAGVEGISLEQRANGVLVDGGWGIGGWHNGWSVQWSDGPSDADEPHGCTLRNGSLMGVSGNDRMTSVNGYDNVMDGVYQFNGTTRSQNSCSGSAAAAGKPNIIKNWRVGAYRMHSNVENESWTLAHLWSSTGTFTAPRGVGVIKYISCLLDSSNGVSKYGVALCDAASREDWIGPNQLILEGVTLKVSPTQECALRLVERSFNKTATVTFNTSTDRVLWTANGLTAPAAVRFTTTGALPTGITAGTTYYVLNKTTDDFQVSATPNGSAIDLAGSPSGTHTANTTQVNRAQTFKHIRIIQESGAAVPQIGYQENKSAGSDTGMVFGTLADFFNGATAVHHKIVQGTSAQVNSKLSAAPASPEYEPVPGVPFASINGIDSWKYWIDPNKSFGEDAELNYLGEDNFVRFFTQFAGAGETNLQYVETEDPVGTFDTGAFDTVMTATEIRRDVTQPTTPTYAVIKRTADPTDPSRMCFEYSMDKTKTGWVAGEKFRDLLHVRNGDVPFDLEWWAVIGLVLPQESLYTSVSTSTWIHLGQFHNGIEDMLNNASMPIEFSGGNGDPNKAYIDFVVRRFQNQSGLWPMPVVDEEEYAGTSVDVHKARIVTAPQAGITHYIIFNGRWAPGFAPNPATYPHYFHGGRWQNIYGPLDEAWYPGLGSTPTGFVKCYYAAGEDASPVLVSEYNGWCGSPIRPGHIKESVIVTWRDGRRLNSQSPSPYCGIYSDYPFEPAAQVGTVYRVWNRGWKGWLAMDNPGMTAQRALDIYKKPS